MSKHNFIATSKDPFLLTKNTDILSQQLRRDKIFSQKQKDMLLPIQPVRKQTNAKPICSQGKSTERSSKMPIFELLSFKDSLLLKKTKDSFKVKTVTRKRTNTNRVATQKIQQPLAYSAQKKHSTNKILIRGGGYSKDPSPQRNNYLRNGLQVIVPQKRIERQRTDQRDNQVRQSPNRSLDKKLTHFERQEAKQFQVLYIGPRRISSLQDFTDSQGDPRVAVGDAIAYKYQIISLLGRGSFGKVFRAYDHKKSQYVAIKIIKNQQKFTNQAKVQIAILETALLQDPKLRNNIVRLKGSFIFRGHTCLKFQILSKNLYQFIKDNNFSGFSLDLIRRFAIQILQALHFFHKHKIIHCDLKPQNILLKQQNKSGIKVIDVGSGCFQGKQIYTYIQSRFYRAPEIVLGVKYTTAIDMWSFGCILVQLYTGIPLLPGETQNQQMLMFIQLMGQPPAYLLQRAQRRKKFFDEQLTCKIPPIRKKDRIRQIVSWKAVLGNDCDRGFHDLVQRCLVWDPEKRMIPKQALLHDWILSGLPHTIRGQHVDQLNND